jgi:hypothetical protein
MLGFVLTIVLVLIVSRNFNPYLIVLLLLPVFYLTGMYRSLTGGARRVKRDARSLEDTFVKVLLRDALVIDSGVWRHESYRGFFEVLSIMLAAAGKKIILYDCQCQELTGAANRADAGDDPRQKTAPAQTRVELFRARDLITREPADIASFDAVAPAGPAAVQALVLAARTSRNVTLVSDSSGVIAQARKAMKQGKTGITIIDYLEDLEAACRQYNAAVAAGKVIPLSGKRR